MRTIFAFLFVFFFLILGLPVLGVEWMIGHFGKEQSKLRQSHMVQWAFRMILRITGTEIEVSGLENIPEHEAVLFVGNHRSIFDVLVTYIHRTDRTGYIAKLQIKRVPALRIWMKRLNCIFIDKDDIKQSLKVILAAIEKVKEGVSITIFPEGTRSRDTDDVTEMLPFKEGSFKVAQKTGCKIIPMAILGTDQIFEAHMPWMKKAKVKVIYGTPIEINALDKETQKHIGAYCQEVVADMLRKAQ